MQLNVLRLVVYVKLERQKYRASHKVNTLTWPTSRENLVFGVCNQIRQTGLLSYRSKLVLRFSDLASKGIILSRQWTTEALIRLRGCAGWCVSLVIAYGINRFSHDMVQIIIIIPICFGGVYCFQHVRHSMILLLWKQIRFLLYNFDSFYLILLKFTPHLTHQKMHIW